jgi:leader peptidase (prepilin peptidase)/N-methyltransferase
MDELGTIALRLSRFFAAQPQMSKDRLAAARRRVENMNAFLLPLWGIARQVSAFCSLRQTLSSHFCHSHRMSRYEILNALLHLLVFFLGAGIGSFLNVVIYRLPRGISVNQPRRSFCPTCKNQIPMWLNIPLLSWILLRGKCAKCSSSISSRYLGVEFLTGVLFYAVFWKVGGDWLSLKDWGPQVLCLWIFVSLLVAGTFIDIEHFILPHEITIGGTVVGLISAAAVPALVAEELHLRGFLISLASAALGPLGESAMPLINLSLGASPSPMMKSLRL